jgi:5'-nucleotidase
MIAAFRRPIAALMTQEVGIAAEEMPNEAEGGGDNPMGDVIADAMLAATRKAGSVAAFVNAGGVRAGIEPGPITYGTAISVEPFGNTLVTLDLSGAELQKALDEGIGSGGQLIPSDGTSYSIDKSAPSGSRVKDVVVASQPVDPAKIYRVTFLNFTSNGGDAHVTLKSASGARTDTGLIDVDSLIDYIKGHTPLKPESTKRIRVQ